MEFVYIIILSFISITVLFVLTKMMGYRQISEMSFFDYVIGISIGSIAAEMATNIDLEWWKGVSAMVFYAVAGILLAFVSQRSIKARKFISGQPIILIDKGRILKDNLKKARIDIDDLISSARGNGYFNLEDIDYAVMETTGKISFMPIALKRQLNPKDFNFAPEKEGLYINVILDGHIMQKDLEKSGFERAELERQIRNQGKRVEDIMLATVDSKKQLTLYDK